MVVFRSYNIPHWASNCLYILALFEHKTIPKSTNRILLNAWSYPPIFNWVQLQIIPFQTPGYTAIACFDDYLAVNIQKLTWVQLKNLTWYNKTDYRFEFYAKKQVRNSWKTLNLWKKISNADQCNLLLLGEVTCLSRSYENQLKRLRLLSFK